MSGDDALMKGAQVEREKRDENKKDGHGRVVGAIFGFVFGFGGK